jgi:eukaryotic-like serine/threonine-protein kinase
MTRVADIADLERRAKAAFDAVVERTAGEREAAIAHMCGDDETLRARVRSLLAAHDHAENFLDPPPPLFGVAIDEVGAAALAAGAHVSADTARDGDDADDTLIGKHIGRYRVQQKIASGGMGVVYLAEQEHPRRNVALKVIRSGIASRSLLRRFEHEAEVLGQLQHPGIAQVYEAGTFDLGHGGQPYFAMEYVRGRGLLDYCETHALSVPQRLKLLARICDAVHYAHQKGVIHRDLKPDNILVVDDCEPADGLKPVCRTEAIPKILDFGVARATDSDIAVTTLQTDIGQIIGTLPYMSPEQVTGDPKQVDIRSDVYALGVVAWELLTGRTPLDVRHKSVAEAARIIEHTEPPPLSAFGRGAHGKIFRGDLNTILLKALEKDRTRRYQSASDLGEDIRRFLRHEPISARPATTLYQLRKFARRNKALVAGVAGVFLMLVLGVVGTTIGLVHAQRSAGIARQQRASAEQVSAFLQQMLGSVNPATALGRDTALLREILDHAAQRVEEELADQPDIAATLHGVIGRTYASIAEYDPAIEHLQLALDARRSVFGNESVEVVQSAGDLGRALSGASRFAAAHPLLVEALETSRRLNGPGHPETARCMNDLGNQRRASGAYAEAETLLRQAVQILEGARPEEDPARLRANNDLAGVLLTRRKLKEARPLFEQVRDVRHRTLAPESPELALAEANLARVLTELNEFDAALPHMQRALVIYRKVLPSGHDTLAGALLAMASLQYHLRDYEQADSVLQEALDACRTTFGEEHPAVARILQAQANLSGAREDEAERERLCLAALEMRRKTLPADHPDIAQSLRQLSGILLRQGKRTEALQAARDALEIQRVHAPTDFDACETILNLALYELRFGDLTKAESLAREAMDLLARLLGEDHVAVSGVHSRLAAILEAQSRYDEALEWRQRVLDFKRRHNEPANEIAGATEAVGLVLMRLERWSEAEGHLREAMQLFRSVFGAEDFAPARPGSALGECLTKLARYPEAEIELLEAERLSAAHPRARPNVQETRRRLVDLYRAWNKPEQAETWRAKLSAARPDPGERTQR